MTRIRHPQKYGTTPIYRGGTPTSTPTYDPAKLPTGYVACPVCSYPARTSTKNGTTVRAHHYQGSRCPGTGLTVEDPPNGVYVPDKVVYSAKAVACPTCGAAVNESCTTIKTGNVTPYPHKARTALHIAQGSPAVLLEGTGTVPDTRRAVAAKRRVDNKAVPCPDCKVDVGEPCTTKNTHTSRKRMAVRKFNHEVHGIEY